MGFNYFPTCVLGMKWDSSFFEDDHGLYLIGDKKYKNIHVIEHEWDEEDSVFRPLAEVEDSLNMNCFHGYANKEEIYYFGKQISNYDISDELQETFWFPDVNEINSIARTLIKHLPTAITSSRNKDYQIVSETFGLHFFTQVL